MLRLTFCNSKSKLRKNKSKLHQKSLKVTYYAKSTFFMSFIHQHVSPLLHVSSTSTCVPSVERDSESFRKKILSLFVLIHLYKNLSENELIRFWPLYDVITFFWLV